MQDQENLGFWPRIWVEKEDLMKELPDNKSNHCIKERPLKQEIAKLAYKAIKEAMKDFEESHSGGYEIGWCWDECLWVDDEFFNPSDLE